MKYHVYIDINEALINYEIENYGEAIVIVPSAVSQDDIDAAYKQLCAKYDHVEFDADGDMIIKAKP